ncbi:MAG: FAD/NAD(P)-binding protein [Flavobacteriales bacterium]|nr:FAD/NAD(P)-binding protein [Flavobacteriales bacterium]
MLKSVSYGIVGGGLSGTLLCIYLMKYTKKPLELFLFEKQQEQLHKGVAYSSELPYQLLNVPVKGMSLFEDDALHFYAWLKIQNIDITPDDFVSRKLFGEYLTYYLEKTVLETKIHQLHIVNDEVVDIEKQGKKQFIFCKNRDKIEVSKVFLCTGNFPASHLRGFSHEVLTNSNYVSNPWNGENLSKIKPHDTLLVIGTGLTMVDQVMSITKHTNFRGNIIALSRRGLLPLPHGDAPIFHLLPTIDFTKVSFFELYQFIKNEVKRAESQGLNYRCVMECIRPHLDSIWKNLSISDKKQFINHFKPYWEVHRHRIPASSADYLKQLQEKGILELIAGRILSADITNDKFEVKITPKGKSETFTLKTDWIIYCTGSQLNYKSINSPLYKSLINKGYLTSAAFDFGLNTADIGFGIDSNGIISNDLILIGPTAKGNNFWEITALKEIRQQIRTIVHQIT